MITNTIPSSRSWVAAGFCVECWNYFSAYHPNGSIVTQNTLYWAYNIPFVNKPKIFEMPLFQICWTLLFDTIHHRGQLSSYYRVIGVAQPELYGPTYEVEEAMMAKAN